MDFLVLCSENCETGAAAYSAGLRVDRPALSRCGPIRCDPSTHFAWLMTMVMSGAVRVGHAVWAIVDIAGSQKSVDSMALRPE
ncbi:uncharacterized protein BO96DRAFT_375946 [Aspergillus niger CBS 101883]|uniref:Uncharacterized protein n=2 Tax=Aspergillus niger TaxID=5061 RepID=A2QAD1_ASPNC